MDTACCRNVGIWTPSGGASLCITRWGARATRSQQLSHQIIKLGTDQTRELWDKDGRDAAVAHPSKSQMKFDRRPGNLIKRLSRRRHASATSNEVPQPAMSLNAEPADPEERAEHDLPPKSYAEAAEEALTQEDEPIDEDAIKEPTPKTNRTRGTSSPRPLGEVMDEAENSPPLGSPQLRHPRGRLENKDNEESYADVVKHPPGTNGMINGNGTNHVKRDRTPDTFQGVGSDDGPRSPVRKVAPKRASSRSLNINSTPHQNGLSLDEKNAKPGALVYENLINKSGENLASIKPDQDFHVSFQQREDKMPLSERALEVKSRQAGELVSGRRAGAGWSRSAIRWAPLNVPLQRRLQTLLVLLHTLSIVGGLALFFLFCAIPLLWPILVPYLAYAILSPASTDGELAHRSEWLRSSKVWSLFGSYFPARLHRSQTLEPTRKYIFGYHPHGIISHGAFAAFATEALGFGQLFPGITNTLLTLDSNFRIPLYRDYALRMGLASVSRESCENILSKGGTNGEGMGRAITIVVGGARESLDAKPNTLRLVLKRRKGFVKLAIRTGADLVPVLAFGENDLYDQLDSNSHPYVHRAQLLVKKFMGFTVRSYSPMLYHPNQSH